MEEEFRVGQVVRLKEPVDFWGSTWGTEPNYIIVSEKNDKLWITKGEHYYNIGGNAKGVTPDNLIAVENGNKYSSVPELPGCILETASTIEDFEKIVCRYSESINGIPALKNNPRICFRGHSKSSYKLKSSLSRISNDEEKLKDLEQRIISNLQIKLKKQFYEELEWWDWLIIAQHHGLPTRLFDFTFDINVALYFASTHELQKEGGRDEPEEDGVIYAFNCTRLEASNFKEFIRLSSNRELSGASMVKPEYSSPRMRSQSALIFYPHNQIQYEFNEFTNDNIRDFAGARMFLKIVIKKECKRKFANYLKSYGYSHQTMFPNFDSICSEIYRKLNI